MPSRAGPSSSISSSGFSRTDRETGMKTHTLETAEADIVYDVLEVPEGLSIPRWSWDGLQD